MVAHLVAHHGLRRWSHRQRFGVRIRLPQSHDEDRDQLLHRESRCGGFLGHSDMLAADGAVGRDEDVVLWQRHLQTCVVHAGKLSFNFTPVHFLLLAVLVDMVVILCCFFKSHKNLLHLIFSPDSCLICTLYSTIELSS